MTTTTATAGLGALLSAGQVLTSAAPARRTVPETLPLVAALVGAAGAAVTRRDGVTIAGCGEPYVEGRHRLGVPVRAAGDAFGELAVWRDAPFEVSDEHAVQVAADLFALALRADALAAAADRAAVAAVEEERAAVAAELHDDVLQTMVAARYAGDLARRGGPAALDDLGATLGEAISSARDTVWALRPRTPAGDLPAAWDALAERLSGRGVTLRVAARGLTRPLPAEQAALGYRIVQEAAALAVRRYGAGRVDVEATLHQGLLRVRLTHDGLTDQGAPVEEQPLVRWVRRIERLGGRVSVRAGAGWLVAELPPGDEVTVP